jgi:regulator of protease activity HflC (stomatin/prohibitin superfamily)
VVPTVASVFREIAPAYLVREMFSTKREEIRQMASARIATKLGGDGIIVKEVVLRDIQLPQEYAKGLEGLLLKSQENERLTGGPGSEIENGSLGGVGGGSAEGSRGKGGRGEDRK